MTMNLFKLSALARLRWMLPALVALFIAGGSAQTTIPGVDLSVGPLTTSTQAVNIALALSVEFPTAGAAYRSVLTYSTGTVYIGYWDSSACYQYFDENDTSSLAGQYFWRTGSVDGNGYCNTSGAGTGYSGNMLNWAATSSIDNLRLALTGGNRVVDTAAGTTTVAGVTVPVSGKSVLGRAYLPTQFSDGGFGEGTGGYWPPKQIPPALVGLVTPAYLTPGGNTPYSGTVFIKGCQDRIFFGNSGTVGSCATPGNANIFAPNTPNLSGSSTTLGFVVNPTDTATTTYVATSPAQAYWGRAIPNTTTTILPVGVDAVAGVLIPEAVSPAPRNATTIGTANAPQYASDPVTTVTWTATSGTTTVAPTTQVIASTNTIAPTTVLGTALVATGAQAILAELPPGSPQVVVATNQTANVCFNASNAQVRLAANTPSPNAGTCPSPLTRRSTSGLTLYQNYAPATIYRTYTANPVYTYYQTYSAWYVPAVYTVYNVYTNGVAPTRMNAAVQVCAGNEATTRQVSQGTYLCQQYPNGNYKPVGQLQINSLSVRASAFGYLIDNVTTRYGGVMRAPMKFVGPTYRDTAGNIQTNPTPEWDANSGVYVNDPLGASPTYAKSGVINYLNGFGNTGSYKGYDPVGELWYETLRYFQGLPPTPAALSGATTAMYGGWPAYDNTTTPAWVDPIQNGCQRSNFILTIGDVNTWYDKQLPGLSTLADTTDVARAAVTIPGTTATFDATYWTSLLTGFETGVSVNYTDSLGRAQNTLGNPSPNSSNTNLQGKTTGAGSSSAYYWAGAAYWANTQAIRQSVVTDSVTGKTQTTANIRVRTYTIDVDEGGNGQIDGNPRGIAPRQSSFYLAGKYGWFKDSVNKDGSPFGITVNGLREWENPSLPNTPDGYTLASQAANMIAGIQKFFAAAVSTGGSLSVSALSSQRYSATSQSGDVFSSSFDSSSWSGTLYRRSVFFNTSTFSLQLSSGNAWDAGQILTSASISTSSTIADPYVSPNSRNIWTFRRVLSGQSTIPFTTSSVGMMDANVVTALGKDPATSLSDGRSNARIQYVRGDRSQESGVPAPFRLRASIMGDVINSGPAYKAGADPTLSGPDYATFTNQVATRTPMVYIGANDGMLHGFRANDGKEIFSYIPLAVSKNLNKLTNPAYTHVPFVDGVPSVGEAQVNGNWRTVLAGGMGGGAKGVYALDVSFPDNFGAASSATSSSGMWEFTDQDDPMMGSVLSEPAIVKINTAGSSATTPVYKWFVAVGSGYNNYLDNGSGNLTSSGIQALFLLSLDRAPTDTWQEGVNYFKIQTPIASTTKANGLATPGVLVGVAGDAKAMYAGDLQGRMWKFDFSFGLSSTLVTSGAILRKASGVAVPLFTAADSAGNPQPISVAPQISYALTGGYMVTFGTGKFIEQSDNTTAGVQGLFSVWDPADAVVTNYPINAANLYQRTAVVSNTSTLVTLSTGSFTIGTGTGQKRGCYINLPQTGERVGVQGDQGGNSVAFNSLIPTGSCTGDGTSVPYQLDPTTCGLVNASSVQSNSGYLSKPNYIQIDFSGPGNQSLYTSRRTSGARKFQDYSTPISLTTGGGLVQGGGAGGAPTPTIYNAGRVSWRELKSAN